MNSRSPSVHRSNGGVPVFMSVAALSMFIAAPGWLLGSEASAQSGPGSESEVSAAIAFRESFGLRSGRAFVEDTTTDQGYSRVPYGVPLSSDEIRELRRRLEIQMSLGPATTYAQDQPGYAGVYLDQQRDGRPVFLFTRSDGDRDAEIGQRLGGDVAYEVREVDHSLAHLRDVKYEVVAEVGRAWDAGVFVVSVGPDIERNRVAVDVEGLEGNAREYMERYGPEVALEEGVTAQADACTITDCFSAKAGLQIVAPDAATCTQGPYVRRGSANRLITAGHCFGLHGLSMKKGQLSSRSSDRRHPSHG